MFEFITNHRFLLNFKKYRYLLFELTKRSIKLKYRKSKLGIIWSFLNPLFYILVLTLVFASFFNRDIANYPVYLLSGRMVFSFFSEGTNGAMTSIKSSAMLKRIYMPKYLQPLSRVLGGYFNFVVSILVLITIMLLTGASFSIYNLLAIIPVIILFFLTLGVGLTLSTVFIFIGDLKYLYKTILTLVMWTSAIFYPATVVPVQFQFILKLNPVYCVISMMRDVILYGKSWGMFELIYSSVFAIIFLILGAFLLYKYQDKFILYM